VEAASQTRTSLYRRKQSDEIFFNMTEKIFIVSSQIHTTRMGPLHLTLGNFVIVSIYARRLEDVRNAGFLGTLSAVAPIMIGIKVNWVQSK